MASKILPILLAAGALTACMSDNPGAPVGSAGDTAANTSGRQCFWAREANGFAASDQRFVNVRVGVRRVFQLETIGPCPDVDWAQRIAIQSRGSSRICTGFDADIIAPSPIGPQRCLVRAVRQLTEEEIAALPARARP